MTRKRGLAPQPSNVIAGDALWLLRTMALGADLWGSPLGLNPRKQSKWKYLVRATTGEEQVKERTVEMLAHRGLIHGRAGTADGKPFMRFEITEAGHDLVARSTGGNAAIIPTREAR